MYEFGRRAQTIEYEFGRYWEKINMEFVRFWGNFGVLTKGVFDELLRGINTKLNYEEVGRVLIRRNWLITL